MQSRYLAPLLILLGGCAASPAPNYDAKFGDAVRQARQLMTLNPDAGKGPGPAVGVDGKAAAAAMGRYQESFKAPPPVVNVINIGGGVGAGGGN
jgi:hypothetical protein